MRLIVIGSSRLIRGEARAFLEFRGWRSDSVTKERTLEDRKGTMQFESS